MSTITTVKIPEVLKKGFSFDEAILVSEMCKRAYAIYQESFGSIDGKDILDSYNVTYNNEDWVLVYPIRNFVRGIRAMILKRKSSHHYAIAFRGTVATQQGIIDITNFLADFNSTLVNYGDLANLVDQRIKVIQGIHEDYKSIEQEILMFFKVLTLGKIEPQDWELLRRDDLSFEQRVATAVALSAAGGIIFGTEFQSILSNLISQFIKDFQINPLKELGYFEDKAGEPFASIVNFNNVVTQLEHIKTPTFVINRQKKTIMGRSLKHINVYVGGHSKGAGLADFCALSVKRYLSTLPDLSHRLKSYKIGGIKVGNKPFADYANKTIGLDYSYRIENTLDFALNIPFSPPYPLDILSRNGFRIGDFYLAEYHHIGIRYTVTGQGSQGLNLDFGGALRLFGGIPFPHGFDTYIQLLKEQRENIRNLLRPFQGILFEILSEMLAEQQENIVQAIKQYTSDVNEDLSREISIVQETLDSNTQGGEAECSVTTSY